MKTPPDNSHSANSKVETSPPLLMQSRQEQDLKVFSCDQKANYANQEGCKLMSSKTNIVNYSPRNLGKKEENCDR